MRNFTAYASDLMLTENVNPPEFYQTEQNQIVVISQKQLKTQIQPGALIRVHQVT